jgi:hypothetical protein
MRSQPRAFRPAVLPESVLVLITLGLSGLLLAACRENPEGEEDCAPLHTLAGHDCAGVVEPTLGTDTWYTAATGDVTCGSIVYASSGASGGSGTAASPLGDLPEAVAAAAVSGPGTCIALAAGTYQGTELPSGVSLLGRGIAETRVEGTPGSPAPVLAASGTGVLIRGVRISGDGTGLQIQNADRLTVDSMLVDGTRGAGVSIADSSHVNLVHVRVARVIPATDAEDDVGVGVLALRANYLRVSGTLIELCSGSGLVHFGEDLRVAFTVARRNNGYGMASTCSEPPCLTAPDVGIEHSLVDENQGVGLWLSEVSAVVDDLIVRGTARDRHGSSRGLEGVSLPDLQLTASFVGRGDDIGVLLHDSSARLTGTYVSDNQGRGLWIQALAGGPGSQVQALAMTIRRNRQVGVGVLGNCNVELVAGTVTDTFLGSLVTNQGPVDQGDGIQALPGSTVRVDGVFLRNHARKSILADAVASLSVVDSWFDTASDPVAVQHLGVSDLDDATHIQWSGNQTSDGAGVSPSLLLDPLGCDTDLVALTPAERDLP